MSDTNADTSTPADRFTFAQSVGSGAPRVAISLAPVMANCNLPMDELTAYALGLEYGATFAQGSALMAERIAGGHAPL